MTIEMMGSVFNSLLLLVIFFYQKNRNKVLLERISQQEVTLNETKGLVANQFTAIEGQSKVVDTAIKYSESFSPEKLESIIRREVVLEQREENERLQREVEERESRISRIGEAAEKGLELAQEILTDLYSPTLEVLVIELLRRPKVERDAVIEGIRSEKARGMLSSIMRRVESEINPNL